LETRNINLQSQINSINHEGWNSLLNDSFDYNIFQSYEWGELKKYSGWTPSRVQILDNDVTKLIAQILVKKVFGMKVGWCPGGPLMNANNVIEGKSLLEKFKNCVSSEGIIILRCKSYSKNNDSNKSLFSLFPKSSNNITSSKTIIQNVTNADEFLKNVRKKHRYSIKQSEKNKLVWKALDNTDGINYFLKTFQAMSSSKNLRLPLIDLMKFRELNSSKFKLISFCGLENNACLTSCIISIFNKKAFYHYAAITDMGRDKSASYGMIYNLMKYLHSIEIEELDFGGLSEDGSSAGVDFFKEGFNGEVVNRIGEFDIAKSNLYRYIFNKVIQFKSFN
tara:strand:- start:390 stop:1397 length:1008 start_codon:yes stop_codon:yes gene_type:complete